jgi:uncharacterized protein (TIGR03089 family)
MVTSIAGRLDERVRSGIGGEPLITYYDLGSGERTELSAVTFANWVAKTANLLQQLVIGEGDLVRIELAHRHPGHWVTLIWEAACWRVGATVAVVEPAGRVAALVVGPDWAGYETSTASEIIACSLHPLGLGFDQELPTGVIDYGIEVRGQADSYPVDPRASDAPVWLDESHEVSGRDLLTVGEAEPALRRLAQPSDPWTGCVQGLLTPLNSGGSVVVVVGNDVEQVARIKLSERIDG